MRKVLSFVLVLSLVLGSFGMAFAADATTPKSTSLSDIDGLACEDAVRVLSSLDVVSGYADGTYKPAQTVTRAEMASLIIKALGLKETAAVPKFADSKTHWAKGFIAYANTLGIISGRTATTFDPDATVTYDEAATMLIKALGYTDEALVGTYPASYVSRAKVLGILDGIQAGTAGANRGDVAIMLYQALDQSIGKVDKDGNFVGTVISAANAAAVEYDTMLERLGANLRTGSGYAVNSKDKSFILTRTDADDALINVYPYIGAVVSAYENSDGDIIAIKEVFSTFINGTIDDTDNVITDTTGKEYDVVNSALSLSYKDDSDKTTTAAALKNGVVKSNAISQKDDTYYTFAVNLSGKNVKEIYSINQWTINNGAVVDADDIDDLKDNKILGYELPEDDDGNIDEEAFELVGVKSLSDIKADMVVYVYSKDGTSDKEITRVAVGTETVSGVVTKLSKNADKVTIDGKEYKFAAGDGTINGELDKNGAGALDDPATVGEIDVDDEVKLSLDAYGFIYDYDKIAGDADKFAVVLDAGQSGGFKSDYQVELFLADGTSKIFTIDDDSTDLPVTAGGSGELVVTDTSIKPATSGTIKEGSLIKYGLNKNGEINSMELVEAINNKLTSDKPVTKTGYWAGLELKSDAVIFTYSGTDMSDDSNYDVAKLETVLDSDPVGGTYVENSKGQIEGAVLTGFETTKDIFGAVTDWGKAPDDLFDVTMYVDGEEKEYKADVNSSALSGLDSTGMIYKLKFNASGEITSLLPQTHAQFIAKAGFYEVEFTSSTSVSISGNRAIVSNPGSTTAGGMDHDGKANAAIYTGTFNLSNGNTVSVYMIDENGDWSIEKKAELKNVDENDVVRFYNTNDDDYGITTVVVIEKVK